MVTTNGDDPARQYQNAAQAQMGERISNLNRRQTDYEAETRANFRAVEAAISAITTEMRQSFSNISATLAERNKIQWPALSVALVFVGMVGALAYWPIREATNDLKVNVSTLATETKRSLDAVAERMISRQEMDWRSARAQEDRTRVEGAIVDLRGNTVTRAEWIERNRATDQAVAEIGRRTDEIRADYAQTYGPRDVIEDMQSEINRLRQTVNEMRAGVSRQ